MKTLTALLISAVAAPAALLMVTAAPASALPRAPDTAAHGYVLGRFADADDRLEDAARYYDGALRVTPSDTTLLRRTFDTAVAAGDEKLAFGLAKRIGGTPASDSTVALVRLADALKRRDWVSADDVRPGLADAGYAAVVGPIVEAWTQAGRGRFDEALAVADPDKFKGIARSYIVEHRALILVVAKRWSDATPLFTALLTGEARNVARLRVAAADALKAQGKDDEALALLDAGPRDPITAAARERIVAGRPGLFVEPRIGVSWLLGRLALDLAREKPVPLALVFARVSTFLAPELADSWLITGDVLARSGRDEAAVAAYGHVPANDPQFVSARARQALALSDAGRDGEARPLLEAAVTSPGATVDAWVRLGDFERKLLHNDAAAVAYDKAIALAGTTPEATGWTLFFLRGGAYEQSGDWARAEPDLRAALRLAPNEPAVLNYLGYALLDRGIKLPEAQKLIEEASRLKPDDGFITDSLGWAYFRTGQIAKAVPVLERAVALEPGDPTINEHLGDAYWRAGRRIEARFRWRAAIDLGATTAQAASVKAKLDYGLDVALAMAPVSASKP